MSEIQLYRLHIFVFCFVLNKQCEVACYNEEQVNVDVLFV